MFCTFRSRSHWLEVKGRQGRGRGGSRGEGEAVKGKGRCVRGRGGVWGEGEVSVLRVACIGESAAGSNIRSSMSVSGKEVTKRVRFNFHPQPLLPSFLSPFPLLPSFPFTSFTQFLVSPSLPCTFFLAYTPSSLPIFMFTSPSSSLFFFPPLPLSIYSHALCLPSPPIPFLPSPFSLLH